MTAASPMARLCLIGAGGFGRQVLALLETGCLAQGDFAEVAYAGDGAEVGGTLGPYPIIDVASVGAGDRFVVTVSSASARRRLARSALANGAAPHALVATSARVSAFAALDAGAVICDFAVVEPYARTGLHFHANVGSFVAHDCVIGDFVTLGPHAVCNGNVHIGDDAYVGAGAIIRQGTADKPLSIGAGAIVGMGAVVTRDVPDGAIVAGNPARLLGS